jgi:diguanylate cyclase (GGDEF)-like protein
MPLGLRSFAGRPPTAEELEQASIRRERLRLVIRVRWSILAALIAYSVVTIGFYELSQPFIRLEHYLIVPAIALVVVSGYNAFYQLTYERLSHIRYFPHLQILGDILVATVLVHYSGGVNSWFWAMYLLFSVEAAFILEDESDTWLIGAFGALIYGALLTGEYFGVVPHVAMPFIGYGLGLARNFSYVMILWSWVVVMNGIIAVSGNAIMRRLREREAALRASAVYDSLTGLYDATYFGRTLASEVERAKRYRRTLSVLLLRIDGFEDYVQRFGILEGSKLVELAADVVRGALRKSDDGLSVLDSAGRDAGERFAMLAPETESEDALALADRMREAFEAVCVPRPGSPCLSPMTASIAVATYPRDGATAEELQAAVRRALDDGLAGKANVVAGAHRHAAPGRAGEPAEGVPAQA